MWSGVTTQSSHTEQGAQQAICSQRAPLRQAGIWGSRVYTCVLCWEGGQLPPCICACVCRSVGGCVCTQH